MGQSAGRIFDHYPKARPPLPAAHQVLFVAEYVTNRAGATPVVRAAQRLERWMHRQVAARGRTGEHVLELGAGTLNHVAYERSAGAYDAVEPKTFLYRDQPARRALRRIVGAIDELPPDARYDRILSIAVLEHMTDLPREVAMAVRHLKDDGLFQAGVPCEGCLLWALGWRLSTGLAFRLRTGLSYGPLMRHEHVNSFAEVRAVLDHLFARCSVRFFPLPTRHLAFYAYLECSRPNRENGLAILKNARRDGSVGGTGL
jgi:SAM-dependent methyltransferase